MDDGEGGREKGVIGGPTSDCCGAPAATASAQLSVTESVSSESGRID